MDWGWVWVIRFYWVMFGVLGCTDCFWFLLTSFQLIVLLFTRCNIACVAGLGDYDLVIT